MTFLSQQLRDSRKARRSPAPVQTCKAPLLPKHYHYHEISEGHSGLDGASFSGAVFNLSTTIVGAGIMALPAAVKVLGVILGLFAIIAAGWLTAASIDFVLCLSRPPPDKIASFSPRSGSSSSSYAGVASDVLGYAARAILQAAIVVNNLGMLVVYMIIIGDVLAGTGGGAHHAGLVEEWVGRQWWTGRSALLLLTTLFVFLPLISLKRMDSLRYTSALSVGLAVVFVVVMSGIAVVKLLEGSISLPRMLPQIDTQADFWNLFTTVPVLVTAYICHYSIHPIENELKDPSEMKSIVKSSLGLCAGVYVVTSLFGFTLFGEETMDDVLANFDSDLGFGSYGVALADVVRLSYVMHLMLVFPIVFYSLRLNLDGLVFPNAAIPITFDNRRFFSLTAGILAVVFIGATYVPSIWDAFQFTGATAAVAIGFLFPAAIALRDIHQAAMRKDRVLAWLMIVLGVSSSTVAISSDIYSMFTENGSSSRSR